MLYIGVYYIVNKFTASFLELVGLHYNFKKRLTLSFKLQYFAGKSCICIILRNLYSDFYQYVSTIVNGIAIVVRTTCLLPGGIWYQVTNGVRKYNLIVPELVK